MYFIETTPFAKESLYYIHYKYIARPFAVTRLLTVVTLSFFSTLHFLLYIISHSLEKTISLLLHPRYCNILIYTKINKWKVCCMFSPPDEWYIIIIKFSTLPQTLAVILPEPSFIQGSKQLLPINRCDLLNEMKPLLLLWPSTSVLLNLLYSIAMQ